LHDGLPVRTRSPTGRAFSPVSILRRRSPVRTSTRSGRTASAAATDSPSPTAQFYLSNYTKGQGSTLKANPFWAARSRGPRRSTSRSSPTRTPRCRPCAAARSMRHADVRQATSCPSMGQSGITYNQIPGYYFEHLEFREGQGLVEPACSGLPGCGRHLPRHRPRIDHQDGVRRSRRATLRRMNSMIYYSTQAAYKPVFSPYHYSQSKALAILKKHCSGGACVCPAPAGTWTCSGLPAKFRWTWTASNAVRNEHRGDRQGRDEADRHRHRRGSAGGERRLRTDRDPGR